MPNFDVIYGLIVAIVALIPTIIAIVVLVKNIIKNKDWKQVITMITAAVTTVDEYAKEHPDMTKDERIEMILEAVKESCATAGITVDTALIKQITEYIEEIYSWAKSDDTITEETASEEEIGNTAEDAVEETDEEEKTEE